MERGHSFDYMQTDKDFFSPEYIRHILVKLRPWKGLVLTSRLVGSLRLPLEEILPKTWRRLNSASEPRVGTAGAPPSAAQNPFSDGAASI